jgi:hypothetical protein
MLDDGTEGLSCLSDVIKFGASAEIVWKEFVHTATLVLAGLFRHVTCLSLPQLSIQHLPKGLAHRTDDCSRICLYLLSAIAPFAVTLRMTARPSV